MELASTTHITHMFTGVVFLVYSQKVLIIHPCLSFLAFQINTNHTTFRVLPTPHNLVFPSHITLYFIPVPCTSHHTTPHHTPSSYPTLHHSFPSTPHYESSLSHTLSLTPASPSHTTVHTLPSLRHMTACLDQ